MRGLLGILMLASQTAWAQDRNPVLGDWDWKPVQGQCPERHSYRADGTASTESGGERLEKTYRVTKLDGGFWRVDQEVTASNGGKDCLGSITAVGRRSSVFVMPQNFGGYLTCASDDGMSCYGSARPARAKP
jgi:hypothetical protein